MSSVHEAEYAEAKQNKYHHIRTAHSFALYILYACQTSKTKIKTTHKRLPDGNRSGVCTGGDNYKYAAFTVGWKFSSHIRNRCRIISQKGGYCVRHVALTNATTVHRRLETGSAQISPSSSSSSILWLSLVSSALRLERKWRLCHRVKILRRRKSPSNI